MELLELSTKLEELEAKKYDVVVPSNNINFNDGKLILPDIENSMNILLGNAGITPVETDLEFVPTETFHSQISNKLKIHKNYYDYLRNNGHQDLLDFNLTMLAQRAEESFLIRTYKDEPNKARAFLSNHFKLIDNSDMLYAALDGISELDNRYEVTVPRADLSEDRMYVTFEAPSVQARAKELFGRWKNAKTGYKDSDGTITAGFVIGNSEVGKGRWFIAPRIVVNVCANGIIYYDNERGKKHLGAELDDGIIEYSQKTIEKMFEWIRSTVKDAAKTFLTPRFLQMKIEEMENSGNQKIEHVSYAINNVAKFLGIDDRKEKLLSYFMDGEDRSRLGVMQSVTLLAQECEPDKRYDLESAFVPTLNNFDRLGFDLPRDQKYGSWQSNFN